MFVFYSCYLKVMKTTLVLMSGRLIRQQREALETELARLNSALALCLTPGGTCCYKSHATLLLHPQQEDTEVRSTEDRGLRAAAAAGWQNVRGDVSHFLG